MINLFNDVKDELEKNGYDSMVDYVYNLSDHILKNYEILANYVWSSFSLEQIFAPTFSNFRFITYNIVFANPTAKTFN